MKLSSRQSQMLKRLIHHKEGTTANDLAQELGISVRTVHREMPRLEDVLAQINLSLIRQSGYGLRLEATPEQLVSLEALLQHEAEYSSEEREMLLACLLLNEAEPIKQYALASELQVTIPTVTADLDELEQTLAKYDLQLLRKRGYGVQIQGSERRKRDMVVELVLDVLDEQDLFGGRVADTLPPAFQPLIELAGIDRFQELEQALWNLEQQYPSDMSEAAYTKLLVQLSVSTARLRSGHVIGEQELAEQHNPQLASEAELELWLSGTGLEFTPPERRYTRELLGYRLRQSEEPLLFDQPELHHSVHRLVSRMEAELGVSLIQDRVLVEGLKQHLQPALNRLKQGETIRNPLLNQIRKDYPQLFAAAAHASREVYPGLSIPDEEIGYLVMHFGASLERAEDGGGSDLRALVVCTSGIGSSRLLGARLAKSFPRLQIAGHVSWYEASRLPEGAYDLIVSTVDLPLPESRYIKLSPLLPEEDQAKLRQFLKRIPALSSDHQEDRLPVLAQGVPPLHRLQELHHSADAMLKLLEHMKVYRLPQSAGEGLSEVTERLLLLLEQQGLVSDGLQVSGKLMQRESYGSLVLPDSSLAMLHTRSRHVPEPLLLLLQLENPVQVGEPSVPVTGLLVMLAPHELASVQLSLLSEISAMLLEPELIHLLEEGCELKLRQWLAGAWLDQLHRV
ncbi:BglG family transcription antiterminator [Paenibacillus daejeonensis]|uniref:BglG family transcription antiterminator n=1 Tax=Paenibacillus daejeonensis TaxID=135193 RepID=UPI00035F52D8|nr:BglG family transcription antiterminator [Paenibacillus daejeonensis]